MKNKFTLCFRPVAIETEEADHKQVNRHSTSIIVAKEHRNKMISPAINPTLLDSGSLPSHPQRRNSSSKILSRVLKAILLETSPPLRVRDGNIRQLTYAPKNNNLGEISSHSDSGTEETKTKEADILPMKIASSVLSSPTSSTNSGFSSSSTASASSSSESKKLKAISLKRSLERSRSNSMDRKKKAKTLKTNDRTPKSSSNEDLVFCFIVLALFATIIWGKLFAILLTSTWLCFIPNRDVFYRSQEKTVKSPEMETAKEDKKRVIIEGLLERKPIQRALNF